ncbi:MAG: hypothetical protein KC613_01215 [Myxococcales bacterium]|nr:hypothetical protein [Myxococcales bacterium]MCB9526692.1 hypothetical protein [Myxococcales bacterium]
MAIRRIIRRALTAAVASQALVACMPAQSDNPETPDQGAPLPPPIVEGLEAAVTVRGMDQAVEPGAALMLTAEARLIVEGCDGCAVQLAFALGDDVVCAFDGTERNARFDVGLTAPDAAGRHALRYAAVLDGDCAQAERLARNGQGLGQVQVEAIAPPPPPPNENRAPQVQGIDVAAADFNTACETTLTGSAMDPDGDAMQLQWSLNGAAAGQGDRIALPGGPARRVEVALTARDTGGRADTERLTLDLPACVLPDGAVVSADGRSAFVQVAAPTDFDSARLAAARAGGHLATLADRAQMQAVVAAFRGGWIGRWSPGRDGHFESLTGEVGGFTEFCPGEPNNAGGQEWAVELWDIECLNDEAAAHTRPAIVEFELPGGPEDVSAGGAFDRAPIDAGFQGRSVLRLDRPATVRIAVTDGQGGCEGVGDPMLAVLFGGDAVARVDDANGSLCPEAVFEAEAGVYDVLVNGFGGGALPAYRLQVER